MFITVEEKRVCIECQFFWLVQYVESREFESSVNVCDWLNMQRTESLT